MKSPVVVAILAAAVAASGNAIVAYTNARSETNLEAQKAEQARILEIDQDWQRGQSGGESSLPRRSPG